MLSWVHNARAGCKWSAVWRPWLLTLAQRGVKAMHSCHKIVFTCDFHRTSLFSVPPFLRVRHGSLAVCLDLWELWEADKIKWTLKKLFNARPCQREKTQVFLLHMKSWYLWVIKCSHAQCNSLRYFIATLAIVVAVLRFCIMEGTGLFVD